MRGEADTSKESFREFVDSGRQTAVQMIVLKGIAQVPDSTANEVANIMELQGDYDCNVCARITELREEGLVEISGKRECSITQRKVRTYRVTEKGRVKANENHVSISQ